MPQCPYPEPDWEAYPTAVCMTFDCIGSWWGTAYWEEAPSYVAESNCFAMSMYYAYIGGEQHGNEFDSFYVEPFMIEREAA